MMAISAALLALSACDRFTEKPPAAPPPPPEVEVALVAQRDVPVIGEWLGTTDGLVNAEVRSRVQGYLIAQKFVEGTVVKTGDLLYEVDARPFEASLAEARAELAKANAELGRSRLEVARLEPLAPSGAVSQQEVDNAQQQYQADQAMVQAMEAGVQQAELNLSYTKVVSPIDGIAGISQAQVGDLVGSPTSPPLTTISTLDPIRVYFPISEQEYLSIADEISKYDPATSPVKRPIPLDLVLADGSIYPHKGQIDIVNREVDITTGTIRIAARFPNPGNILRPGQYAKVRATKAVQPGAMLIPQRAVAELQGAYRVAVVDSGGKVSMKAVKVGQRVGPDWVVLEGLKPGESVIMEGVQKVRDGSTVTVKPSAPPATTPAQTPADPAAGSTAPAK
jgi:membrane fusion protein (multidrug efflux system)